jgi:hypothetical protein
MQEAATKPYVTRKSRPFSDNEYVRQRMMDLIETVCVENRAAFYLFILLAIRIYNSMS